MRIEILPTFDLPGAATAAVVRAAIERAIPDARVRVNTSQQPTAVLATVMRADAVVLDLTPQGAHRYTAMAHPWQQDHVLAVSRSWLPVNVVPARRGGAAPHGATRTDEQLAAWVVEQLVGPDPVRRRSFSDRLLGGLGTGAQVDRWAHVDAFVSYRSQDGAAAHELRDKLLAQRSPGQQRHEVVLLEPGELAHPDEALPSLLRWCALAVISDIVAAAREFWVVESPEYLGSWWTQGALVCRPSFGSHSTVGAFSAATGRLQHEVTGYDIPLTGGDRDRLARLLATSHPDLMAPESREAMRRLRGTHLPLAGDDVFSEEFWDVPLLQCPRCSLPATPPAVDAQAFLTNSGPRLYPVAPETFRRYADTDTSMPCPGGCGQGFQIRTPPPRYLWYGLPVGPSQSFLEPVQTYLAAPTDVDAARG